MTHCSVNSSGEQQQTSETSGDTVDANCRTFLASIYQTP